MSKSRVVEFYAPPDYWRLSPDQKNGICNGCGPGAWKVDLVPDYPLGFPFNEACNIHDFMYFTGKTNEDKEVADRVFLNNMLRVVEAFSHTTEDISHGQWIASVYYDAVKLAGGPSFWAGKNKPEELCMFKIDESPLFPEVY